MPNDQPNVNEEQGWLGWAASALTNAAAQAAGGAQLYGAALLGSVQNVIVNGLSKAGITQEEEQKFNTAIFLETIDSFLDQIADHPEYNEARYYLGALIRKRFQLDTKNDIDAKAMADLDFEFAEGELKEFFSKYAETQDESNSYGLGVFYDSLFSLFATDKEIHKEVLDREEINNYVKANLTLTNKEYLSMKAGQAWNYFADTLRSVMKSLALFVSRNIVDLGFNHNPESMSKFAFVTAVHGSLGSTAAATAEKLVEYTDLHKNPAFQETMRAGMHYTVKDVVAGTIDQIGKAKKSKPKLVDPIEAKAGKKKGKMQFMRKTKVTAPHNEHKRPAPQKPAPSKKPE